MRASAKNPGVIGEAGDDGDLVLSGEAGYSRRRFDALLGGAADAAHDRPLLEREHWLVAPTLGAIIPNWLLALPRCRALSFRDWEHAGGVSAHSVLSEIQDHLGLDASDIIWFEHGPAETGTPVGCGLDHAHLHLLLYPSFDFASFVDHVRASNHLEWRVTTADESYVGLIDSASYCVAGSGNQAISASNVEGLGSQFFRRMVAAICGKETRWDYRQFAHRQNIDATITNFRRLERAARRER